MPVPHVGSLGAASLALLVFAAIGFAGLAWRRPVWALGAYLIVEPFELARAIGPTTVSLPKAALVGAILGLFARRTSVRPLAARELRPLLGGAIAIVLVTAATFVPATFVDPVVRETLKALEYLALLIVGIVAFAADPDDETIWRALAIGVTIVCTLAVVQEFTVAPSGFYVGTRIVARVAGPIDGPNQLAGWLDVVIPALAARALLGPRSRAYGLVAVFGLATDALTYSRAGAFGLACGVAIVAIAAWRAGYAGRMWRAVALLLVPIVVGAIPLVLAKTGVAGVTLRLSGADETNGDNGFAARSVLWKAALKMFERDPGLGIGAGNYEFLTPTVGVIGVRTHANSLYLQSLAEGGVALVAAVMWTIVSVAALLLRDRRTPLAFGIGAGTVALAAHEIFDTLVFYPKVGDMWWLLVGIGASRALSAMRAPSAPIETA